MRTRCSPSKRSRDFLSVQQNQTQNSVENGSNREVILERPRHKKLVSFDKSSINNFKLAGAGEGSPPRTQEKEIITRRRVITKPLMLRGKYRFNDLEDFSSRSPPQNMRQRPQLNSPTSEDYYRHQPSGYPSKNLNERRFEMQYQNNSPGLSPHQKLHNSPKSKHQRMPGKTLVRIQQKIPVRMQLEAPRLKSPSQDRHNRSRTRLISPSSSVSKQVYYLDSKMTALSSRNQSLARGFSLEVKENSVNYRVSSQQRESKPKGTVAASRDFVEILDFGTKENYELESEDYEDLGSPTAQELQGLRRLTMSPTSENIKKTKNEEKQVLGGSNQPRNPHKLRYRSQNVAMNRRQPSTHQIMTHSKQAEDRSGKYTSIQSACTVLRKEKHFVRNQPSLEEGSLNVNQGANIQSPKRRVIVTRIISPSSLKHPRAQLVEERREAGEIGYNSSQNYELLSRMTKRRGVGGQTELTRDGSDHKKIISNEHTFKHHHKEVELVARRNLNKQSELVKMGEFHRKTESEYEPNLAALEVSCLPSTQNSKKRHHKNSQNHLENDFNEGYQENKENIDPNVQSAFNEKSSISQPVEVMQAQRGAGAYKQKNFMLESGSNESSSYQNHGYHQNQNSTEPTRIKESERSDKAQEHQQNNEKEYYEIPYFNSMCNEKAGGHFGLGFSDDDEESISENQGGPVQRLGLDKDKFRGGRGAKNKQKLKVIYADLPLIIEDPNEHVVSTPNC